MSSSTPALRQPAAALCEDRLADAEALLIAHLDNHPTDVAALRMMAEVLARAGRHEDAERVLGQCLEVAPNLAFVTAPLFAEAVLALASWQGALRVLGLGALLGAPAGQPVTGAGVKEASAILSGFFERPLVKGRRESKSLSRNRLTAKTRPVSIRPWV